MPYRPGSPCLRSAPRRSFVLALAALALWLGQPLPPLAAQSDGDLDSRYGDGGLARHNVQADLALYGLACAPDATCYTAAENSTGDFRVRGIDAQGSFVNEANAAFNLGGGLDDTPFFLAVGADGKPVVAGIAEDATDQQMAVARFAQVAGFPPFVLDTGFSGDGKATQDFAGSAEGYAVAVGPSGEVVVVGCYLTAGAAGKDFAVVRFLPDGTPDPGFDGNGVRTLDFNHGAGADNDCAYAVAVLPDGRILAAGEAQFNADDYDFAVARLMPDGSLDTTFSGDGLQTVFFDQGTSDYDSAGAIAVDRFGRVVLAGMAETDAGSKAVLARLTSAGGADTTFDGDGKFLSAEGALAVAGGVAVLSFPSERILYLSFSGLLAALTESGAPDATFGVGGEIFVDDPLGGALSRRRLTVLGGMPLVGGESVVAGVDKYFVARYWMDQIFGDDFESGNASAWAGW